jgi:hypothetical protein
LDPAHVALAIANSPSATLTATNAIALADIMRRRGVYQ